MLNIPRMMSEEYQELLKHCVHCGLCLEACPTYAVFGTEMDSPRGRIALMRAAVDGRIDHEAFLHTFAEHITLCLECRACESACPSQVEYGKLIEGARIALEDVRPKGLGERFVSWLGMHQLMPHVGQLKLLARLMWLYEASGLQRVVRGLGVLPAPLSAMEGILPPISVDYPDYSTPALATGERRGKVAFFYGCIQEAFLATINAATIRVLQRNGYDVHFPQSQTCCGAAQWHTGDEDLAKKLAKQNIDAFLAEDFDAVVNNAGGCGLTLKEYPDLLRDDPDYADKAQVFADKVVDFSDFILTHMHVPPQGALRIRATYSDSCHLRHGQGVVEQPRDLLSDIPGLELVELQHPERCCGSAGIYNIVQSATANAVLDAKMEDIAATGAEVIVTSNTGCHMQLVSGVRRARLNAKVLHIAEVLDLSYQVAERTQGNGASGNDGAVSLVQWLSEPVKHPKPLFGQPKLPEHWLAWQERRLKRDTDTPLASLREHLTPGQVLDNPVELLTYGVDAGLDRGNPLGVIFPYTTEDVQAVLKWGNAHDVPIIARGAGTGLAGGAVALHGGLLLTFSHMKSMLALDLDGRSAVVQPGMVNQTLDEIAKGAGLYFPPDPASGRAATLGGNIGANAGGPHCFKYGVTSNYVTGLEVVLADGRSVSLGGPALDMPEIDLVGLMVGSEGTLGVITQADVRLVRNPPAVKTMLAAFDSVEQAGEAVSAVIAAGLVPATMEMMGQRIMRTIENYNHPGLPVDAGAALVIDVDGYPASVAPQIAEVSAVLKENGATEVRVAQTEEERERIWYARKSAGGALAQTALDHYTVDGTVPRSKLSETLHETIRICEAYDLPVVFLLHAGDGNLHPMVLVSDPEDEDFLHRLHEGGREMAALCVAQGGTISGEHGIGIEKRDFMSLMYNQVELDVMHEIKTLFDPGERLNPDKVFPVDGDGSPESQVTSQASQGVSEVADEMAPAAVEEAADMIRGLAAAQRPIRPVGAGTKSHLFPQNGVRLSTRHLSGVRTYARDDLYVTVGAGTPLSEVQAELVPDGLWIPVASPWPEATVGGIVGANFNAPLRMRYGAIRDLVQAMTVVLPDGRVVRAGRPVMKNVAGYDLTKLFIGAYGTLGLIADVTFKLVPQPRMRSTLAIPIRDLRQDVGWMQTLLRQSLVAASMLLCRGVPVAQADAAGDVLLYTAEGLPEDVDAELTQVRDVLRATGAPEPVVVDAAGSEVWADWLRQGTPDASGMLVRLGLPPKALPDVLMQDLNGGMRGGSFIADFANGQLFVRGEVDLAALRKLAGRHRGYAVVLDAAPTLRQDLDLWGYTPDALDMMRGLKACWDQGGVFNPDVFVI